MVVVDEFTEAKCTINVLIQYDALLKYCKECRLQGHNDEECRKLNPNLRKYHKNAEEDKINGKVVGDPNAWALMERKKTVKEKKGVIKAINSPSTDKMVTNKKF